MDSEYKEDNIPVWQRYTLSIKETAAYFGVGEKKIRRIVNANPSADFVLLDGSHVRIKRIKFEHYVDESSCI